MTDLLPRWARVALACAGVLGLAVTSWASAALAEATSAPGKVTAPAAGGSAGQQLWVTRFSQAAGTAVAASPTGGAVFVTGNVTIGYDAATGAQRWVSQYDGPAKMGSVANAVTVSPDGSRVFVTGQTLNAQGDPEYATVAYDASAGTQLWASLHAGHAAGGAAAAAEARAIVVSPDGKVVYVTGFSGDAGAGGRIGLGVYDYVTIAYDAATGTALWSARYDNGGNDQGRAIAISPSGHVVYVTGRSLSRKTGYDDATIAYNAATGKKLWAARYNGKASKNEFANAIAVSPDGKSVYITGGSHGRTSRQDLATVGYSAATGRQLWARRYNGPGNLNDSGRGIAVSPNSATVVATGLSTGKGGQYDIEWATIASNAKTGAARWTKRYGVIGEGDTAENIPEGVVVNPRGGTVYVTGAIAVFKEEGRYGTVAYSVSTGAQKWAKSYVGVAASSVAAALAISPDGHALYVTGQSESDTIDIATIAYRA
jgi:DNA-binding beta-propeller fold protein YncE